MGFNSAFKGLSPDLSPRDYHRCPAMKPHLEGYKLKYARNMENVLKRWLTNQARHWHQHGTSKLVPR